MSQLLFWAAGKVVLICMLVVSIVVSFDIILNFIPLFIN